VERHLFSFIEEDNFGSFILEVCGRFAGERLEFICTGAVCLVCESFLLFDGE